MCWRRKTNTRIRMREREKRFYELLEWWRAQGWVHCGGYEKCIMAGAVIVSVLRRLWLKILHSSVILEVEARYLRVNTGIRANAYKNRSPVFRNRGWYLCAYLVKEHLNRDLFPIFIRRRPEPFIERRLYRTFDTI